jgi:hypothetical protein
MAVGDCDCADDWAREEAADAAIYVFWNSFQCSGQVGVVVAVESVEECATVGARVPEMAKDVEDVGENGLSSGRRDWRLEGASETVRERANPLSVVQLPPTRRRRARHEPNPTISAKKGDNVARRPQRGLQLVRCTASQGGG